MTFGVDDHFFQHKKCPIFRDSSHASSVLGIFSKYRLLITLEPHACRNKFPDFYTLS